MAKDKKGNKKEKKKKIIRKTNVAIKKKKKKWVSLMAPKEFGGGELGESLVVDPKDLVGRNVITSLSNLNRGKNFAIKIIFRGKEIIDGNCLCEPMGYYVLNSFARRVVKKGKTKIFKSLKLKTKDNVDVVLKIVLVTRRKITGGVSAKVRAELDSFLSETVKKADFMVTLDSIINYSFQKKIKEQMKGIYPVGSLEIVMFRKVFK